MAKQSPTNELTQRILNFFFERRIFAFRQNVVAVPLVRDGQVVGFRAPPTAGIPDIQAIVPRGISSLWPQGSGYLGIEVKSATTHDRLRPSQIAFHANARAGGGAVIIVVNSFQDFLEKIKPILDLCHIQEK